MRISAPTFTQTPNDLFDHWLPKLCESELKVLLIILRKTFGWHKTRDYISISMLANKTGMTEETVIIATKSLQKKGLILKEVIGPNGKQQTYYELIVEENSNNSYPSDEPRGPLGLDRGGQSEAQKKTSILEASKKKLLPDAEASEKIAPAAVVVFPCLNELEIPESLRKKISKEHSIEKVEVAVKRCKQWVGRSNDSAGIMTALRDFDNWTAHEKTNDSIQNKEKAIEKLAKYQKHNTKLTINILNQFIEFLDGSMSPICVNYSDFGFMDQLENAINKMIGKNLMKKCN